jgi:hypothetical protein
MHFSVVIERRMRTVWLKAIGKTPPTAPQFQREILHATKRSLSTDRD